MDLSSYQAGQYERQLEYRSFVPTPIHHAWIIADPQVSDLLSRADRALGALNAFSQLVPDIDFFITMYVAKEATQSSRIEGTQTNIEDAFKDLDDLRQRTRMTGPRSRTTSGRSITPSPVSSACPSRTAYCGKPMRS